MAEEKLKISGKVIAKGEMRSGISQKGEWVSQEYVIETNEQYPKKICFELFGKEKIESCDIGFGDEVEAFINIDAKEYKGRWYNSIRAWAVNKKGGNSNNQTKQEDPKKENVAKQMSDVDNLPF